MKLLFATNNINKVNEIRSLLDNRIELISLKDIDLIEDIPETSNTIEGNAIQKANYIKDHFQLDCFADDTGLEVDILNGDPGVYSARYAGDQKDDQENISKLLKNMDGSTNRKANFKTVIALNINGEQFLFEGIVNGIIRNRRYGTNGFGYDPVFEPENCGKTFGEMELAEKNKYSHRARAFSQMIAFLSSYSSSPK